MHKALIIDDSSTVRSIIQKMLTSMGFECLQASDGKLAYEALENASGVEVAFVDWNMPVMTGIQFVQLVREKAKYSTMKLVMVTTETGMPQIASAIEAGADEYIMKPFTKEILLEKLRLVGVEPCES